MNLRKPITRSSTILPQNVHSLTDFLRHPRKHLQELKRSRRPTILTLNGKPKVVVQDVAAYYEILDAIEAVYANQGIAEGVSSMERGEGEPADKVFARLRKKNDFTARALKP